MNAPTRFAIPLALSAAALGLSLANLPAMAQSGSFTLSSPDLADGTFADKFVLNGFGCKGGNVSPTLVWSNVPSGTKSLALQIHDSDAPTGSGFWHWTVYNIPPTITALPQGAGNSPSTLPVPAWGGANDYLDTGATGVNGNYGGPCPPVGDKPHRYNFTLYALAVDDVQKAGGIPKTGTPALFSFVLNKGLGANMLGKATFTATYGR
jgi:Raf kinase inhibitor-like YbhB/YbcL family protein